MSTSVHVLLPDSADLDSWQAAPQAVLDLFERHGVPSRYSAGRYVTVPPSPYVAQFNVHGEDQVETGKTLLRELERLGFEARLYVHHGRTGKGAWWPDAPSWRLG